MAIDPLIVSFAGVCSNRHLLQTVTYLLPLSLSSPVILLKFLRVALSVTVLRLLVAFIIKRVQYPALANTGLAQHRVVQYYC